MANKPVAGGALKPHWLQRLRENLRHTAAPWFVLLLSLFATAAAWQYVSRVVEAQNRARFDQFSQLAQDAIVQRMETYINGLRDIAGLFAVSESVRRDEWQRYAKTVNMRGRYPGIEGVGYARRVREPERAAFVDRVRRDRSIEAQGYPDFAIFPSDAYDEYFVVDYIEPFALNQPFFGQNFAADPIPRQAMEQARDTGLPFATAPVGLRGESARSAGFLIFLPVYRHDALLHDVEARQEALLGFVFGRFEAESLLAGIFGASGQPRVDFAVFDGTTLTREHLLLGNEETPARGDAGYSRTTTLHIAGRTWTLRFAEQPSFELVVSQYFPLFVLFSGVLVSLALFGVTWAGAGSYLRAERSRIALRESERRLKGLIENSADLVWAYYFDGRRAVVSRDCCGYRAAQLIAGGLALFVRLHTPDSRQRLEQALEYVQSTRKRVVNLQLDAVDKAGHTRHFLVNLAPIVDLHGKLAGVQGNSHDITELKSAQRALAESESRFWDIIETAHDLVWSVDRDGRWIYLNQATRHIYGIEPQAMLGSRFNEVMHPEHAEKDLDAFRRALGGDEITQHETVHFHADGEPRYLSFNIKARLDEDGSVIGAMGTARDITEQKRYQRQLEHLAEHDVLTGLYNRHYFQRELEKTVAAMRSSREVFGILYIDVDNFKYVNDTLGHAAGDQLLTELSQLQLERIRQGDVLARFGGDEFTVLLRNVNAERLQQVAEAFCELFQGYTFVQADKAFDVRVSIGATLVADGGASASDVLAQADLACAVAKSRGRNQIHIYDPADLAKADMVSDIGWSRKINEALEHDRFVLLYQPIIRIHDHAIDHYEVLLRLRHSSGELTSPGAFLPAAERFGLIHAIDRRVVEQAIVRLARLHRDGVAHRFSINLSGRAFQDAELLPRIRRALEAHQLDPAALTFEITETAAIAHIADAKEFIRELRALGCRFALDDFGSGFSSYGYLKFLPVDYVKIDGSFVQNLARDRVDQAMVQSMNQVAHALDKQTIAEFVEDEASLVLLKSYGIDFAQGFHLGRPATDIALDPLPPVRLPD